MGGCSFGKVPPINAPKRYRGKNHVSWHKISKLVRIILSGTRSVPSITDIVETTNTLIQEKHNHTETSSAVKVSRRAPENEITSKTKERVLLSLVRTWVTFWEAILTTTLEYCWEGKDLASLSLLITLSAYNLSWYTQISWSAILLATQRFHCCTASLSFPS